jgi:hypothetical protein
MNCLSEKEIQEYLDHELTQNRLLEVEQHLKNCSVCKVTYNQAQESKSQLFAFLDEYTSFEIPQQIPAFKIEPRLSSLKKYILITSIAASLLLFTGIGIRINNQRNMQKQLNNITKATYEITRNTDLNKMVHNKQIIVVTTNSSGEVIETSLTE